MSARLKVWQWTQVLTDQSLLLGSSGKGVHMHDIVLTYLRGARSALELRALQKRVVDGLVAATAAFDAAIKLARRGRFLLSEALTIRGRALAGRAGEGVGGGSGLHWDEREGKQQLSEVMGRMQGPREPLE
jgi:hypothetical protein